MLHFEIVEGVVLSDFKKYEPLKTDFYLYGLLSTQFIIVKWVKCRWLYNKWTNTRNTGTIENKYSMIHRPGKMYSKFEFEKNFPNSMWNISQNLS